jgi:single-strand DNA-binding protein
MAGSVNKVILIGNLGKDPEVRRTDAGIPVARLALATSEVIRKASGEKETRTEWHNIVLWRGLAEVAEKYLKKGMKIYVEGKLRSRSWEDAQGVKKYATEVEASEMTMLDGRKPEDGAAPSTGYGAQSSSAPAQASSSTSMSDADFDDLPL